MSQVSGRFNSIRTSGLSAWIETDSNETANSLNAHLRQQGVLALQFGNTVVARGNL
jgi:acetylornithine/succinyldiaminopimelate/putrescine aminotransferase